MVKRATMLALPSRWLEGVEMKEVSERVSSWYFLEEKREEREV